MSTLAAILNQEPKPATEISRGVPNELEKIIKRCLRKDPERRFQHMTDVNVFLQEVMERASSGEPVELARRRTRPALVVGALFACLAALLVAVWLWRSFRESEASPMTAVPLTTHPGHERSPAFSPDGNQVAFSWNGEKQDNFDIYVKLIGTDPPLHLTTHPAEDSDPAWSPDSRWIAFLRNLGEGKGAILLVPPIGGPERKVGEIHKPWFAFGFPLTWSPRGDSLVIVDRESDSEPYGLFVLSLESGEKRRLTSPPALTRGDGGPAFSPDGRTIAFVRTMGFGSADLYLLPVGQDLRVVGEPRKVTSGRRQVNNPAWAPGGRELIFSFGFLGFGLFEASNLWRVGATGSEEPQPLGVGEHGFGLCISQERHRLVYSREVSDVNIWRVESSGSHAKSASPERFISSTRDDTNPQISSDGRKVVFSSNRSGSDEIWICDQDGSNLMPLTSFGKGQTASPRWSPDSRWVSFDSNHQDGQFEVYVMEVGGGQPRRLTSHPAVDAVPSWSRDGKWIYFGSNRSGSYQVWRMRASGGEASQLTQKGGFVPLESPDGKFVYYMKGYDDRRIWSVPSQGGEEAQLLGPIFWRDYDVAKDGIYFIPEPDSSKSHSIRFFSFATGKIRSVASIENPWGNFITVSPDGRSILYPKLDLEASDLMLVENFR
jgi:Tol biopolymer transport system component